MLFNNSLKEQVMTFADDILALKQSVSEIKTSIASMQPVKVDLETIWAAIAEIKAHFTLTQTPPVVETENVPAVEPATVQLVAETAEQTSPLGN